MDKYYVLSKGNELKKVPYGWSWPGFCFSLVWLLIKGLFIRALVVFGILILTVMIINFLMSIPTSYFYRDTQIFIPFTLGLIVGFNINEWYVDKLIKKGYDLIDIIKE